MAGALNTNDSADDYPCASIDSGWQHWERTTLASKLKESPEFSSLLKQLLDHSLRRAIALRVY